MGVLALQGAFDRHRVVLERLGANTVEIRRPEHLDGGIDALVLPGGESTTMSKLLVSSGLWDRLATDLRAGLPVLGTCAGAILLSREVHDGRPDQRCFGVLDAVVQRNGYGRQIDSCEVDLEVVGLDSPFHAVFIRAPRFESLGPQVEAWARWDDDVVVARQGNVVAATFHPELTGDDRLHQRFLELV